MGPFRKLLLVGVGVLALHGVQACAANETELNPQPLPPQGGEGTGAPPQTPADPNKNAGGADTTGATPPAPAAADAGTEGGDAADGGDG